MNDIPDEVSDSIRVLIDWMKRATDDQRIELRNELMQPYCDHCGYADPNCQCWNDE